MWRIAGSTRNLNLNPSHIVSLSWIRRLRVKPAMTNKNRDADKATTPSPAVIADLTCNDRH
ncbi:MAG: hypothetical protein LBH60_01265, partial [Prevotellaceae bacterium]|nr:hypothetical protein [Prevotellaceae bacterium]